MDSVRRAIELLRDAEGGLRGLMQEEIASGRYADLSSLASLADGVAGLIARAEGGPAVGESFGVASDASGRRDAGAREFDPAGRWGVERASGGGKTAAKTPKSTPKKKSKKTSKYPFFEIGDGWIRKVGWSKKNRAEYRHYAPVSAAIAFAAHVDATQEAGRIWAVEDLGEIVDGESGEALPGYQVYLIIAWMRAVDLVAKQGRSGYVAVGGGGLRPGVEAALAGR